MTITQYRNELKTKIQNAIDNHGSMRALSLALNRSQTFVKKVMDRESTSGLEKLCKLIEQKGDSQCNQ
jgi:predicted DNA-binding ArsR family transcriptional regulator